MSKSQKIIILGSGTSTGIPMLGCHCPVCSSKNPKDKRMRTSLLIRSANGKQILVDTTPDLRTQFLDNRIDKVDAAIITHDHADHLHGIDDLRPLCFGPPQRRIPIFTHEECARELEKRFPYIFKIEDTLIDQKIPGGGIPLLELHEVNIGTQTKVAGEQFLFFLLPHGNMHSLGLIHGKFCYIPDAKSIPDETVKMLKERKLDLLIIDCLKPGKHDTHFTVDEAFHYIHIIAPKRAGLIHMSHHLFHDDLAKQARHRHGEHVCPVYDGQIFECQ
jgi:phosphoribosyl 1,2-cyclic phosphate phosphodiesterase